MKGGVLGEKVHLAAIGGGRRYTCWGLAEFQEVKKPENLSNLKKKEGFRGRMRGVFGKPQTKDNRSTQYLQNVQNETAKNEENPK